MRLRTHHDTRGHKVGSSFVEEVPVGSLGYVVKTNVDGWLSRVRAIPSGRETNWGSSFAHYWEILEGQDASDAD